VGSPEPVTATAPPAPAPAAPESKPDVDQWRDYTPLATEQAAPPAPNPAPLPVAAPAAAPAEETIVEQAAEEPRTDAGTAEANPWNRDSWQVTQPGAAPEPESAAANEEDLGRSAELAALGIPVPAVHPSDETETAVAALIEETNEAAAREPVGPFGD